MEYGSYVSSHSNEAGDYMNEAWQKEFHGRCVSCRNANTSTRKNEMQCNLVKSWSHGLPSRPGGTVFYQPVHKMFGCVYWADMDADMGIMKPEDKS